MISSRLINKLLGLMIIGFLFIPVSAFAAFCGDGALNEDMGEQCDDGNFINRDGCSAYCEIEDMDPPTVASISIPDGTTGVDTLTNTLTVVFSETMDPDSINDLNVWFEHAAKPMSIDLDLADDQKTLTITINQELFSEDSHALKIKNVKDVAGNRMADDIISVFHTAVAIDYTPPNVVVKPTGGTYNFAQDVKLTPYIDDYTGSDEFIDETAKIYYTLNDINLSENSPVYSSAIPIREGTTLRYFAVDGVGNKTPVYTERYSFACPEYEHAKSVINRYPECEVLECNYGFVLKSNVCVIRMGGSDPDDYKANAVTAPLFSSDTPMTISTKPAIFVTREHRGIIARPIIFKDLKRGTIIQFERNTKITDAEGKPFSGYIRHPNNLYIKDFPINFGYSFRSIFEFKAADGRDLQFDPPYKITIPYTDAFNADEKVIIFTYNPDTEKYSEYSRGLYDTDLEKKEVIVRSYRTGAFFIAQTGKNFNKSVFNDVVTHWAKNYIEELYRKGIVKGRSKGIYAPNENLTRAEFLKIALKAIGAEVENPDEIEDVPFADVPLYAWYAAYVKKAHELGLISGYDDGTFRAEQVINRAEAVKILFSAFGFDLSNRPVTTSIETKKRYIDLKGSQWYFPYADFAIQKGIMSGVQDGNNLSFYYFGPGNPITRAEMAKLAIKTIELAEEANE